MNSSGINNVHVLLCILTVLADSTLCHSVVLSCIVVNKDCFNKISPFLILLMAKDYGIERFSLV